MSDDIRTWNFFRITWEAMRATGSTDPITLHRWCAEKLEEVGSPRAGYHRGAIRALGGDQ